MEHNVTMMKDTILSMLKTQMELLEVDFDDALKDLGRSSRNKHKTQDEYAIYFERQDKCNICEAKVNLMHKIIRRVDDLFGNQTPMLTTAKM